MAQYDLLLTQNVHASGVEFSEKYVNIAKGSILSADTAKTPTVLPVGADHCYLVADSTAATGLAWRSATPSAATDLTSKAYVDALLASNAAMIFKGTIGTGGTYTIAAFNALTTYNAGWVLKVIEAGTVFGNVCEINDQITCIVSRSGTGAVNADFVVTQANIDGAVTGPVSATADSIAVFNATTGKIIKDGGKTIATLDSNISAALTAGNNAQTTANAAIPKATLTAAEQVLVSNGVSSPTALSVPISTVVGRLATGSIVALTGANVMTIIGASNDTTNGYMSAAQALKLSGIAAGSQPGTVTSVGGTGTVSGLTLTGTVTTSGNLTLGGTLSVTASNFASQTAATFLAAPTGAAGTPTFRVIASADLPATIGANTTGTAANVTGTVAIANGGTGATSAAAALTALGAYPAANPSGYTSNALCTAAEINTGTDNVKYATPLAIAGSTLVKNNAGTFVADRIATFVDTTGKTIKDAGKTIADLMENWTTAPATKTSTGTVGQKAFDANFFYICQATNVWKRTPIVTNW